MDNENVSMNTFSLSIDLWISVGLIHLFIDNYMHDLSILINDLWISINRRRIKNIDKYAIKY